MCGVISIGLMIDWTNVCFGLMLIKIGVHNDYIPQMWSNMFFNKFILTLLNLYFLNALKAGLSEQLTLVQSDYSPIDIVSYLYL